MVVDGVVVEEVRPLSWYFAQGVNEYFSPG